MASVKQTVNVVQLGGPSQRALYDVLSSMQADLVALQTAVTTLTAQLDADAGVTDTDYAANCDPTLTTTE